MGEESETGGGGGGFVNGGRGENIKEIAILGMSRSAQGPSAYSGGGFLAADDVIQPYHLPKAKFHPQQQQQLELYETEFQEGTPTLEPGLQPEEGEKEAVRRADEETDELLLGSNYGQEVGGAGGGKTVFDPMQLDERAAGVEDEDEEMEEISVPVPVLESFIPKSMQELAEDEAKRREEDGKEGDVVEMFEEIGRQPTSKTNGKKTSARNTRASTRVSGTSTPTIVITPAKGAKPNGKTPKTNGKANGKAKAAPPAQRQSTRMATAKKRKRDEEDEEDEEEGESSALSELEDDYAGAGGGTAEDKEVEDDVEEEEERQEQPTPSPSPSKRPRRSTRKELNYKEVDAPAVEAKTNGRTLRSRKSRT